MATKNDEAFNWNVIKEKKKEKNNVSIVKKKNQSE